MQDYQLSLSRGRAALIRQRAVRAAARSDSSGEDGVFNRLRWEPRAYEDGWRALASGEVFCSSTTRRNGWQMKSNPPPAGRHLGNSFSPRKLFGLYPNMPEGGTWSDRARQRSVCEASAQVSMRLSSRLPMRDKHEPSTRPFCLASPPRAVRMARAPQNKTNAGAKAFLPRLSPKLPAVSREWR